MPGPSLEPYVRYMLISEVGSSQSNDHHLEFQYLARTNSSKGKILTPVPTESLNTWLDAFLPEVNYTHSVRVVLTEIGSNVFFGEDCFSRKEINELIFSLQKGLILEQLNAAKNN